jgi:hypothetical protein
LSTVFSLNHGCNIGKSPSPWGDVSRCHFAEKILKGEEKKEDNVKKKEKMTKDKD